MGYAPPPGGCYPEGSIEPAARPEEEGLHGPDSDLDFSGGGGELYEGHVDFCGRPGMTGPTGPTGPAGRTLQGVALEVRKERAPAYTMGSARPQRMRMAKTYNSFAMAVQTVDSAPRSKSLGESLRSDSKVPASINVTLT